MARPKPKHPKIQTVIYLEQPILEEVDDAAGELAGGIRTKLIEQWIRQGLQEWKASKGIQEEAAAE